MPWAKSTKGVSPSVIRGRAISPMFNTTTGSNCPAFQVAVVMQLYVIQRRRREWCWRAVERGHCSGGWWAAGDVVHVAS